MNVELITMDPAEAREKLREYRRNLHRRADAEYEAVAKGLAALADGTPIVELSRAIAGGGFDAKGRPRLAVSRADRGQVRVFWERSPSWTSPLNRVVYDTAFAQRRGRVGRDYIMRVETLAPAGVKGGSHDWGFALVPMIPAPVRNAVRFRDSDVYILWEVEEWSDTQLGTLPDRDPYLLRHLHGDAYAVLAEWDLTPLERAVMAGRRNAN